jgi:hypothetical protein
LIKDGLKPVDYTIHRGRKAPFDQKQITGFQVVEQCIDRLLMRVCMFGRFESRRIGGIRDQPGFVAHRHEVVELEFRDCSPHTPMGGLGFLSKLTHPAESRDSPTGSTQLSRSFQRCHHRIGIRVVSVVDHQERTKVLDLETISGNGGLGQAGTAFLERQAKLKPYCGCQAGVGDHVFPVDLEKDLR